MKYKIIDFLFSYICPITLYKLQAYNIMNHNFKGYTPFMLIKYCQYSVCCTICPFMCPIRKLILYLIVYTYLIPLSYVFSHSYTLPLLLFLLPAGDPQFVLSESLLVFFLLLLYSSSLLHLFRFHMQVISYSI